MWPHTSVELFTGAGGLALGIERAGFQHLAVVEFDKNACATVRANNEARTAIRYPWPVHEMDVRRFDFRSYFGKTDLLAGGAPCQPFSLGGKHQGDKDKRNMFPEVLRALREIRPTAFLLENVRGLTRQSFSPYFEYIIWQLRFPNVAPLPDESWEDHKRRLWRHMIAADAWRKEDASKTEYEVDYRLVDSANYGVPQRRQRILIIGFRRDLGTHWSFPDTTHSEDALLYAQWVDGSYWAEHKLSMPGVPDAHKQRVSRLAVQGKPSTLRWRTLRDALCGLSEPVDSVPHPTIANHRGIPGARIYKGHTGNDLDKPAKAIKAGDHGNPGGEHVLVKPDGNLRYLTVRECARIQCFPDNYFFAGSRTEAMRQIGNAVPVTLAEMIATQIRNDLDLIKRRRVSEIRQFMDGAREPVLTATD